MTTSGAQKSLDLLCQTGIGTPPPPHSAYIGYITLWLFFYNGFSWPTSGGPHVTRPPNYFFNHCTPPSLFPSPRSQSRDATLAVLLFPSSPHTRSHLGFLKRIHSLDEARLWYTELELPTLGLNIQFQVFHVNDHNAIGKLSRWIAGAFIWWHITPVIGVLCRWHDYVCRGLSFMAPAL
jgi:hypothetical protein